MLHPLTSTTEAGAREEIIALSTANPGSYVFAAATFGLFASVLPRLHAQAPGDCPFGWYALNGKVRPFTTAQRTANEQAGHQGE